jgi:hypothetical protein
MMTTRPPIIGGIMTIASTIPFAANASDVDWKVYGFASVSGPEVCFYEALSVARVLGGLARVWTKCLSQQEMDVIDIKADFGRKLLHDTAQKVNRYYVPPIATVEAINADQTVMITLYEEMANISAVKPHATIFYELNCSEKMMRELSITIDVNGQYGSSRKPGDWKYVPPEGNGAALLKILCRAP